MEDNKIYFVKDHHFNDGITRYFWYSPYIAKLPNGIFKKYEFGTVTEINGCKNKPVEDAILIGWSDGIYNELDVKKYNS